MTPRLIVESYFLESTQNYLYIPYATLLKLGNAYLVVVDDRRCCLQVPAEVQVCIGLGAELDPKLGLPPFLPTIHPDST